MCSTWVCIGVASTVVTQNRHRLICMYNIYIWQRKIDSDSAELTDRPAQEEWDQQPQRSHFTIWPWSSSRAPQEQLTVPLSSGASGSIDLLSTTTVAPPVIPVGDSKVGDPQVEGRGSFTASKMVSSFLPAVALLDRRKGRDPSQVAGPKGLFERNFFGFDLRTTGVFALTGDASSITASSFISNHVS